MSVELAIQRLREQQSKVTARSPQWMVAEQLMDIWRFDREKYDALADLVEVNPRHVRPYGLWTLPEDSLRLHPYIGNFAVAHGIVLFRENNPVGEWSVAALEKAGVLSMEAASKLSRCVIAAPSDGLSAVP